MVRNSQKILIRKNGDFLLITSSLFTFHFSLAVFCEDFIGSKK